MTDILDTIAATTFFWTLSVGFLASIIASITLLFCPSLWWLIPIYAIWIWYDRKTCERGGRPLKFVQSSFWVRFMKSYFKHKLIIENVELDAKKNYILACFPHGIYPLGPISSLADGDLWGVFQNHKTFTTALGIQFWLPFIRELFLSLGSVSVSASSIRYLLKNEKGGNAVSIMIGGGDEAKYSKPGKYKIILNKRKGFIKMAIQNGSPIIPVFTFGETAIFDQLDFPGLAFIREIVKKALQVAIVLPKGDALIIPKKVTLTTVVGTPVEVTKTENPSNEQIEDVHQKFVTELTNLFEKYKHRYAQNPEKTFLEIV